MSQLGDNSGDSVFEKLVEPKSWKLPGVGAYGSDVDVVSLESYLELAQRYHYALGCCERWAKSALAHEKRVLELTTTPPEPREATEE